MLRTLVSPRRTVGGAAAVLAAGAIVAATATAGYAAYSPHQGDLCQAAENIQFYSARDFWTETYVVQTNEFIRIDETGDSLVNWGSGHGEGHSTGNFKYRHGDDSSGQLRLKNCR